MFGDTCMACQVKLETKAFEEDGVKKHILYCPKCKYEVGTLTDYNDMKKWAKKDESKDN